jgi:hypothetical protein
MTGWPMLARTAMMRAVVSDVLGVTPDTRWMVLPASLGADEVRATAIA